MALKKEFDKKTVKRLRNLMTGNGDDKTSMGIGYEKKYEVRSEGDIWEENNKTWTIKDGIKQNITKLDKSKKKYLTPLFCPNCKGQMKKRFDKDYYKIHKKCFDCVVEFETELKRIGAWKEYEANIHNGEIDNFIKEYKNWIEEELITNDSFITESGVKEKWDGKHDKKRVLEALDKTIEHLEKMKK